MTSPLRLLLSNTSTAHVNPSVFFSCDSKAGRAVGPYHPRVCALPADMALVASSAGPGVLHCQAGRPPATLWLSIYLLPASRFLRLLSILVGLVVVSIQPTKSETLSGGSEGSPDYPLLRSFHRSNNQLSLRCPGLSDFVSFILFTSSFETLSRQRQNQKTLAFFLFSPCRPVSFSWCSFGAASLTEVFTKLFAAPKAWTQPAQPQRPAASCSPYLSKAA